MKHKHKQSLKELEKIVKKAKDLRSTCQRLLEIRADPAVFDCAAIATRIVDSCQAALRELRKEEGKKR